MTKDTYSIPKDVYYTKTHEWIKVINDSMGLVGITDYAQDMLHEIVYVDLPEIGSSIKVGTPFMEIESVKSVAEVYAPVSGDIIEVNSKLEESPEILNESPYERGWLVKIKILDKNELKVLMDSEEYNQYLSSL
jgi:glycine cleavage system H protein